MEIVVSATAPGPEFRPHRVVRFDGNIGGHTTAARCGANAAPGQRLH